jgi:AmmeMemoRadiSam system protein B
MFYPAAPHQLHATLHALLAATQAHEVQPKEVQVRPKAIIAPHAGYIYSGPVAASAYALLQPLRGTIRRVVLLGPVHRTWTPGLALPGVDAFDTPLGSIPIDHAAVAAIASLPQVTVHPAAHAEEHSLEVQLPFLQETLGEFSLVPLAVGGASAEAVANVLERLWGDDETLIVVSSDLSHYLPYAAAVATDRATLAEILDLHTGLVGEEACGAHPINGLLLAARRHGLAPHLLDYRNSGDTAGDRSRVVGYAAIAFTEAARHGD